MCVIRTSTVFHAMPRRCARPKWPELELRRCRLHSRPQWWHNVEALEAFNVLVNYWWRDVPEYFDSPSASLLHCLLTIKSLPPEQRRGWKAVFDYLIFQNECMALEHLPPQVRGLFGDLTEANAERIRSLLLKSLARKPGG